MTDLKYRKGKIPILIEGTNGFTIIGGIEDFTFANFCGSDCRENLEEGIQTVIDGLWIRAKMYLESIAEERQLPIIRDRYEKVAFQLINYKACPKELFFLKYKKNEREGIEPQLGKFRELEAIAG